MIVLHTLPDLVKWLEDASNGRIIGIIGPPGSGKTTLALALSDALTISHQVVPMDGFHFSQDTLRSLGRRDRMGAPDTFDTENLARLLDQVRHQEAAVVFPDFDRAREEPIPDAIVVTPEHDLVLVEGNYLLLKDENWAPVGRALDASVYVDIPQALRRQRLMNRHVTFGKSSDEAETWINRVDDPNAELIASSKSKATVLFQPE
jgi:pantothenate kinase